jgi:hypothetical protein
MENYPDIALVVESYTGQKRFEMPLLIREFMFQLHWLQMEDPSGSENRNYKPNLVTRIISNIIGS